MVTFGGQPDRRAALFRARRSQHRCAGWDRLGVDLQQLRSILDLCDMMCEYLHMATNLAIDPDLLERAVAVSGERTKTAAVTQALKEFVARREQRRLLDLFGCLDWDPDYDYKAERSRSRG